MKIQFLGAAQAVTGSCYLIETSQARFAVDCGMHQGNREIDERNLAMEAYLPEQIDFILLTHAHIDHSGLLPKMVKEGFKGPIYATAPTRDLLEIMLLDSAHIQEMEAEWQNRKKRRKAKKPVEPLYTQEHARKTMELFEAVTYGVEFEPAPGVAVLYEDAGHILGSAFLEVRVDEAPDEGDDAGAAQGTQAFSPNSAVGHTRLLFSGDLGRPDQLLMHDPSLPAAATQIDYLFVESTYGDRNHKNEGASREELAEAIAYSYQRGEKVIIPAFAVERTQEVIYCLYLLSQEGKLPADMPVYLDSPMAIRATEVFRLHKDFFDKETQAILDKGEDPLSLPNLRYTLKTEESKAINAEPGAAVVISASGMCNAGRIKHHLRHNLWREGASVVFVGYQARGTPGRKIVDGAETVRLFGEDIAVKARVFTIGGFSAHAGQSQILEWVDAFDHPGMEVFLIHGEPEAQEVLATLIRERMGLDVNIPSYLEEVYLAPGKAMELRPQPERAYPRIDWEYVLQENEAKLVELRARLAELEHKPWVDQSELRDRLVDVAGELAKLVSEV